MYLENCNFYNINRKNYSRTDLESSHSELSRLYPAFGLIRPSSEVIQKIKKDIENLAPHEGSFQVLARRGLIFEWNYDWLLFLLVLKK